MQPTCSKNNEYSHVLLHSCNGGAKQSKISSHRSPSKFQLLIKAMEAIRTFFYGLTYLL